MAGVAAAVVALILRLFHVVKIDILLSITLILGAIVLLQPRAEQPCGGRRRAMTSGIARGVLVPHLLLSESFTLIGGAPWP